MVCVPKQAELEGAGIWLATQQGWGRQGLGTDWPRGRWAGPCSCSWMPAVPEKHLQLELWHLPALSPSFTGH